MFRMSMEFFSSIRTHLRMTQCQENVPATTHRQKYTRQHSQSDIDFCLS